MAIGVGGEPEQVGFREVDTASGRLIVMGAAAVDPVTRSIDALRRALRFGLPALVALVAAVAYVLVGRALRPVEAIRAEVDEITGSTLHRRVSEPPTDDEIGRLARTMNAMLDRLDTTATRQRQFVADASHELRSPVAAIRTGLEVARRKADRANWPAVADTALAEESKLEALLDDLLLLARHDENGARTRHPEPVNLSALIMAEAQRPHRVPVDVALPGINAATEPVVVPGADHELARMVSNLVDNAARHATSAVQIGLTTHDDRRAPDRRRRRSRHPVSRPRTGLRTIRSPRHQPHPRPRWQRSRARRRPLHRHPPSRPRPGRRQPDRRRPLHRRATRPLALARHSPGSCSVEHVLPPKMWVTCVRLTLRVTTT